MPLGIGAAGKAAIGKETTWGTAATRDTFIELLPGETMKNTIEHIEAGFLMGSRNKYKIYKGTEDAGGQIPITVNPDNIGLLLYMALGIEADPAQVDSTTAYDHDFTPADTDTDLGSFTLEIDRGITCCVYSGCTVDKMTINAAKGSLVTATFDLLAKQEQDDQSATGGLSPSSKIPFTFHHGSMAIDTTDVAYVNSFNLEYNNNLDAEGFVLNGSPNRAHAYKTIGTLTGSMEMEWTSDSDDIRDAYLDNTQKQLTLTITSTETIESGYYYTLTIDIPKVHILGDPPTLNARDRLAFTANFEAVYDSTNFFKITLRDARTTKWSA